MKRFKFKSMICGLLLALAFLSSGCSERIDAVRHANQEDQAGCRRT